jgi:hypothetical protein
MPMLFHAEKDDERRWSHDLNRGVLDPEKSKILR